MGNCLSHLQLTQSTRDTGRKETPFEPPPCPTLPIHEPTQSFWTFPSSAVATHGSSDDLPAHADVVIIGSGISAASFARTLLDIDQARVDESDPLRVVMLEAQEACSGATGRNGGHINPPLYHDYEDLRNLLGKASAQQIMRFRLAHLEVLSEVAEVDAVDADCSQVHSADVFFDDVVFAEAKRKLRVYLADMPQEANAFRVWEGKEAQRRHNLSSLAVGCITTRAGAVHPYRLVTDILSRLLEEYPKHFQLFTQTPCTSIVAPSPTSSSYSVITPRGQVTASHVVHLTNAYVGKLVPGLADVVYRTRETMSAQRPGRALQFQVSGTNNMHEPRSYVFYDNPERKGFDYLTQLPGGERELMFGAGQEEVPDTDINRNGRGCRPPSKGMYDVHSAAHVSGALPVYFGAANWGAEAVFAAESPVSEDPSNDTHGYPPHLWAAGRVKALWSGVLSVSVDEFPWVGRIPSTISGRRSSHARKGATATKSEKVQDKQARMADPGEWVAAGYSGEGMVHAWLCSRALALMVLGLDNARGVEAEGHYGAGQTVNEWLPPCYCISVARWKKARKVSNCLWERDKAVARGGAGKMKIYRGVQA